ncbi:DUF2971 domain-containing protein [Thalassotalea sp. PP2-459]|uniref:DUF2971 domain-containing protein n=1 Tax=Thalassotalea sp. PP2-459 TaxID=1742724 RepID=UPI00094549F2|nr:DUF2971 domain-containing protein [Thalassotalea sp. PP2-459]OKY28059.1 hypothetical protein BI291_06380 [Thalassotalea sp. PP2-459]
MKLYRFEKLDDERCDTLANNQLWLSSPKMFNDLNDCKIQALYMPPLSDIYLQTLISTINTVYPENFDYKNAVFSKEIIQEIKIYIENCINADAIQNLERELSVANIRHNILNSVGICCFFSGEVNDPLLWAHYAENHEGFCVEYEYNELPNTKILPVVYSTTLPIISAREIALCPEETITRIVTAKTSHWQYEKEFRLVELFPFKEGESGKPITMPDYLKPTKIITGDRFNDHSMLSKIDLEITNFRKFTR